MGCPPTSIASPHYDDSDSDSSTVPCESSMGTPLSSGSKAQRQARYKMNSISLQRELLDGIHVLAIRSGQVGRRSILVSENSKGSRVRARRLSALRVTFTNVYLREYGLTLGDNPSVSSGPPISMSWEYTPTEVMPLEDFEELRESDYEKRTKLELIVPKSLREKWLRNEWGVSQSDIAAAVREVNKIKHSRRKNFHNLTSAAGKFESIFSKVFDSKSSNSDREASQLEKNHVSAVSGQKRLQAPNHRKNLLNDDNGYRTDSSVCTEPSLGENDSPRLDAKPKKSILKNKNSAEIVFVEGNGQTLSCGKCVSFAMVGSTKKILCSVHEYQKESGRFKWSDEDEHSSLWWLPEEMEFRHELDYEIVSLVEDQLQFLLVDAFKSTKSSCASKETDPETISSGMVKLDFNDMAACDIARGLEKDVIPDVTNFVIKTHRKMVLAKQEILYQSMGNVGDEDNTSVLEQCMEEIRQKSLRYSRPSRLLALKLAAYDEFIRLAES